MRRKYAHRTVLHKVQKKSQKRNLVERTIYRIAEHDTKIDGNRQSLIRTKFEKKKRIS